VSTVLTVNNIKLDAFTRAYVECALWSSTTGEDDTPLDRDYGIRDIEAGTLAKMVEECKQFQEENAELLERWKGYDVDDAGAGHDLWLTRNHHGAGYWDRFCDPEGKELGNRLTELAHGLGGVDLYVGDDGKVHQQ